MAENNETQTTAQARTFKSVNGKSLGGEQTQGNISFVNASRLFKEGKENVIMAEGVLEKVGTSEGKFGEKTQYSIRAENGDLIMVDGFGGLDKQMAKVNIGQYVQITYLGKRSFDTKDAKGKKVTAQAHACVVGVAE